MIGLGIGLVYANSFVCFNQKIEITGKMYGVIFAVYQLGIMFFPWFTGQMIDAAGYGMPIMIITAVFFCSIPLLLLLDKKLKTI